MNEFRTCPNAAEAVGWALHALEPDEELAVVMHLPSCAACRATVRETETVMAGLGGGVEQVDPPSALRARIVAEAAAQAQPETVLRPRTSPESGPSETVPSRPVPPVEPSRPRRSDTPAPTGPGRHRRWLGSRGRRALALSLAVVGVLTVGGLAVRTTQLEQQRDVAIVQAQSVADMMAQVDQPGTSHAVLATPEGTPVGAVLVSEDQRRLVTVGLPANAVDREIYVLWGVRGDTPVALGTFDVGTAEHDSGTLGSPGEANGFTAYAISLEPGRSAPVAPTQAVASGPVEA